jgi:hypothetical protein
VKFRVQSDGVHVVALNDPDPVFAQEVRIPKDFFPLWEAQDRIFGTQFAREIRNDMSQFLGVVLPTDQRTMILSNDGTRLRFQGTEIEYEIVAKMLHDRQSRPDPVPDPSVQKIGAKSQLSDETRFQICDYLIPPTGVPTVLPVPPPLKPTLDMGPDTFTVFPDSSGPYRPGMRYDPGNHRLLVRDTPVRHEAIGKLVRKAWVDYYASEKAKTHK